MALDTVNYRAKSTLVSKTMIANVLAIVAVVLGSDELKSMLGPDALIYVSTTLGMLNMLLRMFTVRPVAFVLPGNSKVVSVEKL